jgi:hypothetical protein
MGRFGRTRVVVIICVATVMVAGSASAVAAPVHRWRAEGNANDSVGTNNGTLVNGATALGAPVEGIYSFSLDGTNDYVEMPDVSTHYFSGSFTIDAWVQPTDTTGVRWVVTKYECGGSCPSESADPFYRLGLSGGIPFGDLRDDDKGGPDGSSGSQGVSATSPLTTGSFHHLRFVRDVEADLLAIYVDGALAGLEALHPGAAGPLTNEDGSADPLHVGAIFDAGTTTPISFFAGLIDDVQLFGSAAIQADLVDDFAAVKGKNQLGDEIELQFDDGNVLSLGSKRKGTKRVVIWNGLFSQIPASAGDFTIHYEGTTSRPVARKVLILNPTTNKFVCPGATAAACVLAKGQSTLDITGSNLAQYRNAAGEVVVRVQGKAKKSYTETSDNLAIAYES